MGLPNGFIDPQGTKIMKKHSLIAILLISLLGLSIATDAWTQPLPPPEAEVPEPFDEEVAVLKLLLDSPDAFAPLGDDVPREWIPQGPGPAIGGQVENITNDPIGNDLVVGAVHAVAPHPSDGNILYLGAVNGGIWRTTNP